MTGWGVLTHVDSGRSARESIERAIGLARVAEGAGYDSFWIAQHRFGDQQGAMPSPLVLLGALARETTRIHLGTASIAAGFDDPRRLVEDAAVVDALSGGRLQLGLGSGSSARATQAWGLDHDDRHDRFWRVVDDVLDAARGGIGDAAARHEVVPSAGGLPARTWVTTGSAHGVDAAARRNLGLIVGRRSVGPDGPLAEDRRVADLVRRYRKRCGSHARVALSRPIVATTDAALAARLRADERLVRRRPDLTTGGVAVGTPEQIAAGLSDDPGFLHADHVLIHTRPLAVPYEVEAQSLALVAERVRPLVR
ncbi:LLM class flavin-dependent oxidoreductase [Prescottella defluvii]|uniref:LLM class flavin-dependent oxidoreductase n=1 Tax=Prescottella defluvii TaxID=1323361 RepID=UPI00068EC560|nr:LLM class flavin-dependent oxidoreductase [Prescottella defluvii]